MVSRRVARSALYGMFGTWFGLALVGQRLYRNQSKRSRWDKLHLVIPDWRFFAPNPSVHDLHLLMRDQLGDGRLTNWSEIARPAERSLVHAVWHPRQRAEKAVFDLVAELLRFIDKHAEEVGRASPAVQLSVSYLTLLSYVSSREHHPEAAATQFLIMASGGYEEAEEPTMVFLSELHPLGADT